MTLISKPQPGKKKALVAGHFCLDLLPDLSKVPENKFFDLFTPGHLLQSGKMNIATGGAASNTGISLSKLGVQTTIIARLGDDGFGKIAAAHLGQYVESSFNQLALVAGETTSYTVIVNPPGVDRIFLHHPGANDTFTSKDVDFGNYRDHVLFHFGYPQLMRAMFTDGGKELTALFHKAKKHGFTTSLDTTFPDPSSEMGQVNWDAVLKKTLPFVDIFCPSFEEAFFMLDRVGYQQYAASSEKPVTPQLIIPLLNKILDYGAKIALLKIGEAGCVIAVAKQVNQIEFGKAWYPKLIDWQNRTIWIPSFNVNVVGTTGAGDAAIAGFLGALLAELPIEEALLMAMGVGGCNVEALDSVSTVRSWQATAERINEGWPQNPLNSAQFTDWVWNPRYCLWEKIVK